MNLARSVQGKLDVGRMIIMDGGTGTEIERRGVYIDPNLAWSAESNIISPDLIRDIHQDYIIAGAEIIITNTFSTSRATLATAGLAGETEEINRQSVKLARDARRNCGAERSVAIAGSMSSFEPKGQPGVIPSYMAALEDYREQAILLAEAGVDLIVLEMFVRTIDIAAAVEAATQTGLPIWVGISCESYDGQLFMGLRGRHAKETIADAVRAAASTNVAAFCIMHSPPQNTAPALQELRMHTALPIGAYAHGGYIQAKTGHEPNINSPHHVHPEKYLEYAYEWATSGAKIIGGCCGTTPEHIRVLSKSGLRDMNDLALAR